MTIAQQESLAGYNYIAELQRMNHREMAIAPHYSGLASDIRQFVNSVPSVMAAQEPQFRDRLCSAYGFNESDKRKPFAFAGGVAIIPIHGLLVNRFSSSWGFVTGYNFIRNQIHAAMQDEDVQAIIADVNSYGGEAAGCFELSAEIREMRGKKPMVAVVDSACYSGAYAITSAFDRISVTPSGGAGSIGVITMHVSYEKALEDAGIKVTLIHAGEHKADGSPYEDLPESVRKDIQASVEMTRDEFVALVAKNRDLDPKVVKGTEARMFRAAEAKEKGLIDDVAPSSVAVLSFVSGLSGPRHNRKEDAMSDQQEKKGPGVDQATLDKTATDARQGERARIAAILGHEEAKGRESLANHLAMNTDLGIEAAVAILSATAKVEPKKESTAANPFEAAMDNTPNPNVGSDGGPDEEISPAMQIIRDQELATGMKLVG